MWQLKVVKVSKIEVNFEKNVFVEGAELWR